MEHLGQLLHIIDMYEDTYQAPANEIHKLGIQNAQRHICSQLSWSD